MAHVAYGGNLKEKDEPREEDDAQDQESQGEQTRQDNIDRWLENKKEPEGVLGLILAPTRELAEQIKTQLEKVFVEFNIRYMDLCALL